MLQTEIAGLIREQTDAMERATFVGMTPNEAKSYNFRRIKIGTLAKELAQLKSIQ